MRKLSFIILISFIFIGFMNAATITVKEPHSGAKWFKGRTSTITWTKSGSTGINVKINIFKDAIKPENFKEQLKGPNTGSKQWTIPANYTTGTYYIRIKGVDSNWKDVGVYGDSGPFTIVDSTVKTASITITNPHQGMVWSTGYKYNITWKTTGIPPSENLFITFFKNSISSSNYLEQITCKNTGSKNIEIPSNFKSGTYYIRINKPFSNVFGDSQPFRIQQIVYLNKKIISKINDNSKALSNIISMAANADITVISPKNGDIFYEGQYNTIKWKTTGLMNNRVEIIIIRPSSGWNFTIHPSTENDGEYKWEPKSKYFKDMKIKVQTIDRIISGTSETFNIVSSTQSNSCNTGNDAVDLECLINNYRKSNGLPAISHSVSLAKVAQAHVKDVATYHPEKNCKDNPHSWSSHGAWIGGCYDKDNSSTWNIMFLKPKEIAGDSNRGYEIFESGSPTAKDALDDWKTSSGHNAVILNKSIWANHKWSGMAAANYGPYWAVWFE